MKLRNFVNIKSRSKNLRWYFSKLILQTRCWGAEHVNIWKASWIYIHIWEVQIALGQTQLFSWCQYYSSLQQLWVTVNNQLKFEYFSLIFYGLFFLLIGLIWHLEKFSIMTDNSNFTIQTPSVVWFNHLRQCFWLFSSLWLEKLMRGV